MISYAQNGEDVILSRAFRDQTHGFYIDIGVWHPTLDSVTKHFYDMGWCGINVEPNPTQIELIKASRERDINLCVAVSSHSGPLELHRVEDTGLSTVRADFASRHKADGRAIDILKVPTLSLREICNQHAGAKVIDFLKIDVEGAEFDVINSGDWQSFRPRIVIVEATEPNSHTQNHFEWEQQLLDAAYVYTYFDGLNRWYLRQDQVALKSAFYAPPNPLDNYVSARAIALEQRLELVESRLKSALSKADRLDKIGKSFLGKILIRLT